MKRYLRTIIALLLTISVMATTASATTLRLEPSDREWSNSNWSNTEWNNTDWWDSDWSDSEFEELMKWLVVNHIVLSENIRNHRESSSSSQWHESTTIQITGHTSTRKTTTTTVNGVTTTTTTESTNTIPGEQATITVQVPTSSMGTITVQVPTTSQETTTVQVPTSSQNKNQAQIPTIQYETSYENGFNQGLKIYNEYDLELDRKQQESETTYGKEYEKYLATTKKLLEEAVDKQQVAAKTIRSYNKVVENLPEKTTLNLNVKDDDNTQGFRDAIVYESYVHAVLEFYYIHDMTSQEYQRSFVGLLFQGNEKLTHNSITKKVESARKILEKYDEENITVPYFI